MTLISKMMIFLIPLAILGCLQAMPDSSANGTTYDNGDYVYTEDDHYRVGDYVSTASDKTPDVLDSVPTANETISGVLVSVSTANPTGTTRGTSSESKKETESHVYSTAMTTDTDESTNESSHTSNSFPDSFVDGKHQTADLFLDRRLTVAQMMHIDLKLIINFIIYNYIIIITENASIYRSKICRLHLV